MAQSIQELDENISKLSSSYEKEFINMKKVTSCHEESLKKILQTLEVKVSIYEFI